MIRRNATMSDGTPAWVLISQIEHARLAGEVARQWQAGGLATMPHRDEVLEAIAHHDDGWAEWEAAPQVDPQSGTPLAFTEMPLVAALAIWKRSIDRCAAIGPLAAWMTAGHFEALLRSAKFAEAPLAVDWLRRFDPRRANWLAELLHRDAAITQSDADRALRTLQFFDMLSLWFCCAERLRSTTVTAPDGLDVNISPKGADSMKLSPWPLDVRRLKLSVSGARIPARPYADSAALAACERQTVKLNWLLEPDSSR
jgi:hypothetical protein